MEELATKRRGRPRKDSPRDNITGEGESVIGIDAGKRETGGSGYVIQEVATRKSQGCTFAELVELVKQKNSHDHRISCVIHPDADGIISTDNLGNIRTEKGECGYVLNTGEFIKLF